MIACLTPSEDFDLSLAKFWGLKKGILAPYFLEIFTILSLSVETINSSIYLLLIPASIVQPIRGLLFNVSIFLFLSLLLPARAGIIAKKVFFFIHYSYFYIPY